MTFHSSTVYELYDDSSADDSGGEYTVQREYTGVYQTTLFEY